MLLRRARAFCAVPCRGARSVTVMLPFRMPWSKTSKAKSKADDVRPVSKLRPKKPLISSVGDSILSVTQMLSSKRGDASLVVNEDGGLAGIFTDTGECVATFFLKLLAETTRSCLLTTHFFC